MNSITLDNIIPFPRQFYTQLRITQDENKQILRCLPLNIVLMRKYFSLVKQKASYKKKILWFVINYFECTLSVYMLLYKNKMLS